MTDVPNDPIVESWSDDGLTLTVGDENPRGRYVEVTVSWRTRELAEENYEKARRMILEDIATRTDHLTVGTQNTARRKGPFLVAVLAGPPTWWLPRAGTRVHRGRRALVVGWLRRALVISLAPKKDRETTHA